MAASSLDPVYRVSRARPTVTMVTTLIRAMKMTTPVMLWSYQSRSAEHSIGARPPVRTVPMLLAMPTALNRTLVSKSSAKKAGCEPRMADWPAPRVTNRATQMAYVSPVSRIRKNGRAEARSSTAPMIETGRRPMRSDSAPKRCLYGLRQAVAGVGSW
ncbi:hypothetical protein [Streptomyces sp. NA02536]|uniref:hypothetical protein n=1 Tax=Streptomyces sp. NA02536 TaxID=2742133 RepID=UPI001591916E|nr:hypothetical protein [Streptomyces sp. NA02536]QKW04486.1 hypothetical protein HUT14_33940 [Streptomyces sp. NA02536]